MLHFTIWDDWLDCTFRKYPWHWVGGGLSSDFSQLHGGEHWPQPWMMRWAAESLDPMTMEWHKNAMCNKMAVSEPRFPMGNRHTFNWADLPEIHLKVRIEKVSKKSKKTVVLEPTGISSWWSVRNAPFMEIATPDHICSTETKYTSDIAGKKVSVRHSAQLSYSVWNQSLGFGFSHNINHGVTTEVIHCHMLQKWSSSCCFWKHTFLETIQGELLPRHVGETLVGKKEKGGTFSCNFPIVAQTHSL